VDTFTGRPFPQSWWKRNARELRVFASLAAALFLGRIEISTIGLAAMILEGTDTGTFRRAVGHFPCTALPGQQGNVAIAGHRDTFFRALRNIRKDNEITLTTLNGSYRYRVDSTKVVEPENTEVLDDSDEAILTLVTCYPFDFMGSAPKSFVVRAHRIPG
jgi:sortase A